MDGDKAIEILQRLPGVTVSGNNISVNGEQVARTYVNGVMIYGNDPSSAFYSLDASQVKEVKIYEEQSHVDKRKGLRNSRKQTVMNVTTKEKIVSAELAALEFIFGKHEGLCRNPQVLGREGLWKQSEIRLHLQ